jgi:hypothetical protein
MAVAPYSGDMLAIVALAGKHSLPTPTPECNREIKRKDVYLLYYAYHRIQRISQ